jgi:hypothetical protein
MSVHLVLWYGNEISTKARVFVIDLVRQMYYI